MKVTVRYQILELFLVMTSLIIVKLSNFHILAKTIPSFVEQWHCHGNSEWLMGLVCIQNETLSLYCLIQKV